MSDALDSEIKRKEAEAEAYRKRAEQAVRKAEQLDAELQVLKRAAELRPLAIATSVSNIAFKTPTNDAELGGADKRGGRQPGSISVKWRGVLSDLVKTGSPFELSGFMLFAIENGVVLQQNSARERLRRYVESDLLEEVGDGKFKVTDEAIKRFDLLGNPKADTTQ